MSPLRTQVDRRGEREHEVLRVLAVDLGACPGRARREAEAILEALRGDGYGIERLDPAVGGDPQQRAGSVLHPYAQRGPRWDRVAGDRLVVAVTVAVGLEERARAA